ncbi:MAG: DUF3667 domain-containing protein [Proteobacteria bacterium]|nr:DUF3667 domain-containing protein [Pseudomonadota bacterium]
MSDLEGILETSGVLGVELAASALAERGQKPGKCPNCAAAMIGPYCAVCGQERDTHRRSVFGLVHDLIIDIVSFDSRILRTARAIAFQPGELPKAFREGRTQSYMPAMRLYLFVSLVFFLVLGATGLAIMQFEVVAKPVKVTHDAKGNYFLAETFGDTTTPPIPISKERAEAQGGHFSYSTNMHYFQPVGRYHSNLSKAAEIKLSRTVFKGDDSLKPGYVDRIDKRIFGTMDRLAKDPAALNGPLTTWIPRALFLLLPLYALILAIFYFRKRKGFYFVDHLVFSLNIHTFGFILLLLAAGAAQVLSGDIVAWATFGIGAVYGILAMRNFYGQSWFWTLTKFATVSFFYTFFCVLPALGVVVALSLLQV